MSARGIPRRNRFSRQALEAYLDDRILSLERTLAGAEAINACSETSIKTRAAIEELQRLMGHWGMEHWESGR